MRRENKQIKKALKTVLVFTLIFSWIFSGWPQVWKSFEFPPKTERISAAEYLSNPSFSGGTTNWTLSVSTYDSSYYQDTAGSIKTQSAVGRNKSALGYASQTIGTTINSSDTVLLSLYWSKQCVVVQCASNIVQADIEKPSTPGVWTTIWSDSSAPAAGSPTSWTGPSSLDVSSYFDESGSYNIRFYADLKNPNNSSAQSLAWFDNVSLDVSPNNTLPIASSASIDGGAASITLTENITTNVVCTAIVTDGDGFANITSVEARLYETSQGAAGTADENHRYILAGDGNCVPSGGSGDTENYTCTFAVQFFANPAGWTCQVTPSDSGGSGTADSDTITMNTTLALNVTAAIAYGDMGLGTNSGASPQTVVVTNTGNAIMDPQVSSAAAMSCVTGTIPVANQEYLATTFTYGSGTDLSGTATTLDLTLPKPTSTTFVTDNSYWGIGIPGTGVGGDCTGSVTFTAIAGS